MIGICCFGVDNLEQLALAAGDEAAETLLVTQEEHLATLFGAGNVRRRVGVAGLIAWLRQSSQTDSHTLVERALDGLNGGQVSAGSPVTFFAGIAWADIQDGDAQGDDAQGDPGCVREPKSAPDNDDHGWHTRLLRGATAAAAAASVGRRRLAIHGAEGEAVLHSARLLCDLRDAMVEDRLTILAQEIRNLAPDHADDGGSDFSHKRHFEILIQMSSCAGVAQPPGRFLPLAEKSELIEYIDRWVFRRVLIGHGEALRQRPWMTLSLNLSGRTLSQPGTWPFLQQTIREAGIDPARLQLEITETSKIADMDIHSPSGMPSDVSFA